MPDDSIGPTADLVARLRDRINGTGIWRTAGPDEDMQALVDRITTLERELAEARRWRDNYERLCLNEIERASSIDDELVASQAEVERLRAALRKMHRRAQCAEGHVQAVHHALTMWRGKRIMKERDGYLARAIVDNVLAELNRRIRRALTRQGETG